MLQKNLDTLARICIFSHKSAVRGMEGVRQGAFYFSVSFSEPVLHFLEFCVGYLRRTLPFSTNAFRIHTVCWARRQAPALTIPIAAKRMFPATFFSSKRSQQAR